MNFPYTSWSPTPFPYGRSRTPVIAPYWNDLDFRNSIPESALYHNIYDMGSGQRAQSLLDDFSYRLSLYTSVDSEISAGFVPQWLLVVTWSKATPYYGRRNQDEVIIMETKDMHLH